MNVKNSDLPQYYGIKNYDRAKKIILLISISFFLLSLTQPAFYIGRSDPDGWSNSLGLVLIGWSGALGGGAGLAWVANPLIFVSWFRTFKRARSSVTLSLLALAFSASFLLFKGIVSDEAGNYSVITERKAGYWLWLISIASFAIGRSVVYFFEDTLTRKSNNVTQTI